MLDGSRRGYMIADEVVDHLCLLPCASALSLAKEVYQSLKARGYGQIDPVDHFVDSFVRRFMHSEHRVDAVA